MDYHFIAFVEKDGILYDLDGRKPAPVNCGPTCKETFLKVTKFPIQCNLDLVTLNLATICDLVTIFQTIFQFTTHVISFDLVTSCDLVAVYIETKSVTKSRLHCTFFHFWLVCKQQLDIYLFREHQNASHSNVQRNNTDDKRNGF